MQVESITLMTDRPNPRFHDFRVHVSTGWSFQVLVFVQTGTAYIKTRTGKHVSDKVDAKMRPILTDAVQKEAARLGVELGAMNKPE